MRRALALAVVALVILPAAAARAVDATNTALLLTAGQLAPSNPDQLARPANSDVPPPLHRLTYDRANAIARSVPKIHRLLAANRGSYPYAYLKGATRWQVSVYSAHGQEIGQVLVDDASGRVLEAWTGFQVAWTMARGYPGAFGRHVNALYVWIPLSVLFLVPLADIRRLRSLRNLDLAVLLSLSVSLAFFNHGDLGLSVPLVYPPLLYLLARMLAVAGLWPGGRRRGRTPRRPVRTAVPVTWLAVGCLFLVGFRVGLNATDSNVVDVGYAGAIGGQKLLDGKPLYGGWPADNQHGDTYGPVNYEAYAPFVAVGGFSGRWDTLPAAHLAAVAFDLLAAALLFLIGRRIRGPGLGVVLAYAWLAYPFTLFAAASNSNDALVGALVLACLLAAGSPPARGALAVLAGLTKFAPLALAPVLATHRRARGLPGFVAAFAAVGVLAFVPVLVHGTLGTFWQRTISFQAARGSPFSVWGLWGGLAGVQHAVQVAAVLLALALAVVPRRDDLTGLAAACAAILIAVQLGLTHWFYLYLPWFAGAAFVALFAGAEAPLSPAPARAPARSSRLVPAGSPG